ncbi:MAG: glycosyltransferase family 2 protein [Lachnospiraceae bacterium]|nr:glycosyltransferase family 2 protein [Lachnospiraceae bacterium]
MSAQSEEKVSVVIPTYNREATIGASIQSVLNQTWQNLEIIIVDDGSTDSTRQVVEAFADDRIRYICQEQNGGASHARNTGIRLAECEFVAFLDSDDEWLPEKLEKQMEAMVKASEDVGLVYCRMRVLRGDRDPVICPPLSMEQERLEGNLLTQLAVQNVIGTPTILARKKCLEQVAGFDENLRCLEDWDMVCRIAEHWTIGFVDEILVDVHDSEGSVTYNAKGYMEARCHLIARYDKLLAQRNILEKMIMDVLVIAQEDGYFEEAEKLLSKVLLRNMDTNKLRKKIDELFRTHSYDLLEETLLLYKDITEKDNDLATVYYLLGIYKREKDAGQRTILNKVDSVSTLLERYTVLKFYLRRMDFNFIGDSLQDFYQFIVRNEVSVYELLTVIEYSVVHKEKVRKMIQGTV